MKKRNSRLSSKSTTYHLLPTTYKRGFTIIEFLVVIVIIGILAALTFVAYRGIQSQAAITSLKSDLSNASTRLGVDIGTDGHFPATEAEANGGKGLSKSPGTVFQYTKANGEFCLSASSVKAGTAIFHISSTNGLIESGDCMSTWKQISARYYHICAISFDDSAYCWGNNDNGRLGNNSIIESHIPVAVNTAGALSGKTIKSISAGGSYTCAIASNNLVYCWGWNYEGELGDNLNSGYQSLIPVAVNMANGVSALYDKTVKFISAGDGHTCVIASDNLAYCWGKNDNGQLGNNSTTQSNVPVAVNMTNGVSALYNKTIKSISAGRSHTCVIASDDLVYCWGLNDYGQLGNNSTTQSNVPVAVNMTNGVSALYNKTVKSITAGLWHTCVIASDNLAYCWGKNSYGQLGNNSTTQSNVPVAVNMTNGVSALYGKTVNSIAAGESHTCAIGSDNHAYCWGEGDCGGLGNNSVIDSWVPTTVDTAGVLNGKTIKSITVGSCDAGAIASDDHAYCWGWNWAGQLGNNSVNDSWVPVALFPIF